jgi:hypothetical protein
MKLKEIYQLAIEMGKQFDPRGDEVNRLLEDRQKEYEKMSNDDRDFFDKETLSNPYNGEETAYSINIILEHPISPIDKNRTGVFLLVLILEK